MSMSSSQQPGSPRLDRATHFGAVLLTGATGFLGRHILWDWLAESDPATVHCLVRENYHEGVDARLQRLFKRAVGGLPPTAHARCHAVAGDVRNEDVLTDPQVREQLLNDVDRIIHCAATVRFDLPLDEARRVNVAGTRNVLHFAQQLHARGRLRRFDYFGTAYVAGAAAGTAYEHTLNERPQFNNTYEQTKWEAEQLVRTFQRDLPITIFRPSIIVGDSRSGYTSHFRVLYWPLRTLARGWAVVVPADPKGIVDVVPVDYVARAFRALSSGDESLGQCYHLAAGPGRQSCFGELLRMAAEFFGVRPPWVISPRFAHALLRPVFRVAFRGKPNSVLEQGELYLPYFAYRTEFDTTLARARLAPLGIEAPRVEDYFRNIMQYCVDSNWGSTGE